MFFCATLPGADCYATSILYSLPLLTGAVALVSGGLLLRRPSLRRVCGAVTTGLSGAVIALGVVLLGRFPEALFFVILVFAWPLFLILGGGLLALVDRVPADPRSRPPSVAW